MLSTTVISDKAYQALEEAVGAENVSREPALLDGYAWQPMINDDPSKWVKRPIAVALPSSTEEVQAVLRVCNEHSLKFKAFATGWGVYGGPTYDNVVQIDLRRMNRIIDIDEKNMYAVVEPYVPGAVLQAEAMKVGLNTHIIGAGPVCSPLASATSGWGVGWDGIYMSYSPRNLLGAEWVIPNGDVVRVGSLGSNAGWFSGDGPGPSLRGVIRGSTGALSGLGVFTRVALKLYNWAGPPQIKVEGLLLDAKAELPENIRFHLCFFPDLEKQKEAVYKIGDAEIGYMATRTAVASFIYTFAPHLLRKIAKTQALREVLTESLRGGFTIMLMGASREEIAHQDAVLRKIVEDHDGITMEATSAPAIGSMVLMNFLRVTAIPMVFRMGGLFATALDRNETWDTQMDWATTGEEVKKKWISRDCLLDDLGDNTFMALYENNMWSHCEEIYQYDARNQKHLEALEPILMEFAAIAVDKSMEPLAACDARMRGVISPLMGNYNEWQKKISAALDPKRAADTGMYCDEVAYDFAKVDPDVKENLDRLIKEMTWTESGPPE